MTQTEALARVRFILSEEGITTGFYSDTSILKMLDSAQNQVITILLSKDRGTGKESESLRALAKQSTINIAASTGEYTLPTDYIQSMLVQSIFDGGTTFLKCTELTYEIAKRRADNAYYAGSLTQPYFYIRGAYIGLIPTPTNLKTGGLIIDYYGSPTAVDASHSFTLFSETHEAIIFLATAECFTKEEGRQAESQEYYKKAINLIMNL